MYSTLFATAGDVLADSMARMSGSLNWHWQWYIMLGQQSTRHKVNSSWVSHKVAATCHLHKC